MSTWETHLYRFKPTKDHRWLAAMDRCPDYLSADIDIDFQRGWQLRTRTAAKVSLVLRFSDRGVFPLADSSLWIPDHLRAEVLEMLTDWSLIGKWWTLRRAHFRSDQARTAWEALI